MNSISLNSVMCFFTEPEKLLHKLGLFDKKLISFFSQTAVISKINIFTSENKSYNL